VQLICADDVPWKPLTAIRDGGKEMKELLAGTDGTPDNYRLVMIREQGVVATTPRHKHNFDQVRIVLSGRANYGPQKWIEPGELAYFPEGTPYGPESSDGDRLGLTLQCGGASGLGYVSNNQVKTATALLKETGEFKNGIYHSTAPGAKRRVQDAFEAVYEHVTGRAVTYPKPRYDEPIKMKPEHFAWQEQPGEPGVRAKFLGNFTERHHEIALVHVDAGTSAMFGPRAGIQLVYVVDGSGAVDENALRSQTAFEVPAGSAAQVTATSGLELIVIGLPIFAAAPKPSTV
jgi:mannose-6-phosphate isomerase-like protein (cupin superfamily)